MAEMGFLRLLKRLVAITYLAMQSQVYADDIPLKVKWTAPKFTTQPMA